MNTMTDKETVAVAVSGGADSLYSLISLQEAGQPVIALHGIFLVPPDDRAAEAAAMRSRLSDACKVLGIPLHVVDCSEDFLRLVVRPFVQSYAEGRTPNPCALCNASIKFGLLLDQARALGASRLATGHYAALMRDVGGTKAGSNLFLPALYQGADPQKDQSYFLALVPRARLAHALFPLAEARKSVILERLAARGIVPPQPGESQEVCFIPDDDYRAFVSAMAETLGVALSGPGPMLLEDGRRVGTHKGLWQYTEGQRKGLGVGWKEPLHVLAKEQEGNVLRLGGRAEMRASGCLCDRVNILLPPEYWPETVLVKTRYRERPKPAVAETETGADGAVSLRIRFAGSETNVAPGQVAAVYVPSSGRDGEPDRPRLAAGGIISVSE